MEIEGYFDPAYVQTFKVYVDDRYVGTVRSADVIEATKLARDKFYARSDQKISIVSIGSNPEIADD